ncbi:MAG: hypothetical protein EP330_24485 [Deltaproteobacteria bacterium]|nr:MAG: hypothetical protein EP330_24485 [Deltaproteobacteria bacterium]
MSNRRGIGRTEIAIGVGAVVLVIALALILTSGSSGKSERTELPLNVDSIRTAEITIQGAFGDYVSAEASPRPATEVSPDPVAWEPSAGFKKLSWAPKVKDKVYGSYQVVASESGFEVTGVSDLDGDGERAIYKADQDANAKAETGENVY